MASADLAAVAAVPEPQRLDVLAHTLGLAGFSARTQRALAPHTAHPPALARLALVSPDYLVD